MNNHHFSIKNEYQASTGNIDPETGQEIQADEIGLAYKTLIQCANINIINFNGLFNLNFAFSPNFASIRQFRCGSNES